MKLIAVLGATKTDYKQIYRHNGKEYVDYFSFLAFARAFSIDPSHIVIIGTKKTRELLKEERYEIPQEVMENFVEAPDEIDALFERCLELIDPETIIDVTQGFRHIPMTLLLASIMSLAHAPLKDILYARITQSDCDPSKGPCRFETISLLPYVERANIDAMVDSFNTSLIIPPLRLSQKEAAQIQGILGELSRQLMANNLEAAIPHARKIQQELAKMTSSPVYHTLEKISPTINTLATLHNQTEAVRLIKGARLFFTHDLLLHAITNLFEGILALIDERATRENLALRYKDFKSGRTIECRNEKKPYKRRNCLKKSLENFIHTTPNHPLLNRALHSKLETLDKLRNMSAHAHATEKSQTHYKQQLSEILFFAERLLDQ
ncbi:MAG: TM1812 family CRISPR-associated protein [Campylobacterales bacterium]